MFAPLAGFISALLFKAGFFTLGGRRLLPPMCSVTHVIATGGFHIVTVACTFLVH